MKGELKDFNEGEVLDGKVERVQRCNFRSCKMMSWSKGNMKQDDKEKRVVV